MNKLIFKISSLAVLFILAMPTAVEAYRFVDSTSTKINDTTYLLTHTYTLGFLNAVMETPILAGTSNFSSFGTKQTVFSIVGASDADVKSIILSNADIVDSKYLLESADITTFTLVSLVTGVDAGAEDVSIALESIPYTSLRDGDDTINSGAYTFEAE